MMQGLSAREVETLVGLLRRVLANVEADGIRVDGDRHMRDVAYGRRWQKRLCRGHSHIFWVVFQTVGFGLGKSKIPYLSMGVD
jgi:hypothetical protein